MSQLSFRRGLGFALALLASLLAFGLLSRPTIGRSDPVTAAWERARAAGSYTFSGDIVQTTIPTNKVTNVGRNSRSDTLHVEGQSDLRQSKLEMQLWSQGGNIVQTESGVAVRVENGKTWVRQGQDGWKEVANVTDGMAPQGDFLAYLAAVRDIAPHSPETRAGFTFTRYSFRIDGPAFAAYMRDQMEATLRAKGELPPGGSIDIPQYYRAMTGVGELWVGDDGLPLRQMLTVTFPEQRDDYVTAQIRVNFLKFGQPPAPPSALDTLQASLQSLPPQFYALLFGLALAALLLRFHGSQWLQRGMTGVVITSLVFSPVVSAAQMNRGTDAREARTAEQDQQRQTNDAARALLANDPSAAFNPHEDPFTAAARRAREDAGLATASLVEPSTSLRLGDGADAVAPQTQRELDETGALAPAPPAEIDQPPTDNGTDTDRDGLTDYQEQRIGTDPTNADTDNDRIPDGIEARGFEFPAGSGKMWYLNPQNADSNGDGVTDTAECWRTLPAPNTPPTQMPRCDLDTDGDGTPDVFDDDNDGDGVLDRLDISSFTSLTGLTQANPLKLTLNNLTPNKPARVQFQLRPNNDKHLWFAFNVLDWPRDDAAQVQDIDGKTYADLAASQGRTAQANESNGDTKLIPMLELRVPAASANLPPQRDLTPYNVSVNNYTADGSTKLVYVPLSVQTDEKTGARVAFIGQMPYLPTGSWPSPHEARLAWIVQVLNDQPTTRCTDSITTNCSADGYIHNMPQVVQTYYDDWTLTGLTVTEDHGAKMAVAYEDPAVDTNLKDDAALWAFATVLDHHFVIGRDENHDGQRDLTVDTLPGLFDRTQNSSTTDDQRFAVPNILRVQKQTYSTLDQAVYTTAVTETKRILDTSFTPQATADRTIKPLMVFAQEASSRAMTLDAARADGGYVSRSGASVTLDMAPAGQPAETVSVVAGLKWMAYCAPASGPLAWQPCSMDDYLAELDHRYASLPRLPDDTSPEWVGGRLQLAQLYYMGLSAGYYGTVQEGTQIPAIAYSLESESATTASVRSVLVGVSSVPQLAVNALVRAFPGFSFGTRNYIKKTILEYGSTLRKGLIQAQQDLANPENYPGSSGAAQINRSIATGKIGLLRLRLAPLGAAGLVLMVTTQVLSLIPNIPTTARTVIGALSVTLNLAFNVIFPIVDAIRIAQVGSKPLIQVLTQTIKLTPTLRVAGIVGLVIGVAITWGFFIYSATVGGLTAGSPEFGRALAETIAATIYAVILFALSATIIGGIIVAILAFIDAVLSLICEAGVDDLRVLNGGCFTFSAAAVKVSTYFLYNYDLMINPRHTDATGADDLTTPGNPRTQLADPSKGFVAGNALTITLPITTHVVHQDPDIKNGYYINLYLYHFSTDNLKSTTVRYSLTQPNKEDITVARNQMTNDWKNVGEDHKYVLTPMYKGDATTTSSVGGIQLQAGLNQPARFYLNQGYAFPAYECFWALVPVCYVKTFTGNTSTQLDTMKYDIFPATLDGFMALASKPDGGLGQTWDAAFPSLADADGDGLRSNVHGGLDPNDSTWDADGDGLADSFELERRARGVAVSPVTCDTDGDGLTDSQEVALGADPGRADTDGDGLPDGQEIWHAVYNPTTCRATGAWAGGWDVNIGGATPLTVHVSSNPVSADSDGDGLDDLAEKQLAGQLDRQGIPYHPTVVNTPPIAITTDASVLGGIVRPGQTFIYTTTVVAYTPLAPGVLDVTGGTALASVPPPARLPFDPATFTTAQTFTQQTNLTVVTGVPTQTLPITSTVRTRLPSSAAAGWTLDPIVAEPTLSGFTTPPLYAWFASAAASSPSRPDSYLLSAVTSPSPVSPLYGSPEFSEGQIRSYAIPGGASGILEDSNVTPDALFRSGSSVPSLATNNRGTSVAVWDHIDRCNTITLNFMKVVTAGPDEVGSGIEPFISLSTQNGSAPAVVWDWTTGGGTPDMHSGDQRGPDAFGFPITRRICGSTELKVYESDGSVTALAPFDLVGSQTTDPFIDRNETLTFTGAGHTIQVNVTVPKQDNYTLGGAVVDTNGAVQRRLSFPQPAVPETADRFKSRHPVVATNGLGFLAVSEVVAATGNGAGTPITDSPDTWIAVQPLDAIGNPSIGTARLAAAGAANNFAATRLGLAVVWIGDRYRVAWKALNGSTIYVGDFGIGGTPLTPWTAVATDAPTVTDTLSAMFNDNGPHLAYDPVAGRTLLVYRANDGTVRGLLFQGAGAAPVASQALFPVGAYNSPRVAYHPPSQGWLVSARGVLGALLVNAWKGDLSAPLITAMRGGYNHGGSSALACPLPSSLPVVDLRFEELPGATTFADSSPRGVNATCVGGACPAAGAPPAVDRQNQAIGTPASDYAVQFDGVDDALSFPNPVTLDFSLAFWYKSAGGQSSDFVIDGGDAAGFSLTIANTPARIEFRVGAVRASVPSNLNDGQWHFVVATRDTARNRLALYLDGNPTPVASAANAGAMTPAPSIRLSGRRASLDNFQVYSVALSGDTAQALSNRTLQSYCVATGVNGNQSGLEWARLRLNQPDTRGGKIIATGGMTLTVDADAPRSAVRSVSNGQYIPGGQGSSPLSAGGGAAVTRVASQPTPRTTIIGGEAEDSTSGVATVEVSVNGGPFQAAMGAGTWSYGFQVADGAYTVQTRATDLLGNVETPGSGITVLADGYAPVINFQRTPTQPLVPARTREGRWTVRVGGYIYDPVIGLASGGTTYPGSGVDLPTAEVRVRRQDAPPAEGGWQRATLTLFQASTGTYEWASDYLFPDTVVDPTGAWVVEMRAADKVGNRKQDVSDPLRLDATAPAASLSNADSARTLISGAVTVTGAISDTDSLVGLDSLEVAFAPIQQVAPLADTVLRLALDERAGSVYFTDQSGHGHHATCASPDCPTAGVAGRVDQAVLFEPPPFAESQYLQVPGTADLTFDAARSFSWQAWVNTAVGGAFLRQGQTYATDIMLSVNAETGQAELDLGNPDLPGLSSGPDLRDHEWHHIVATVNRRSGQAALYVDGLLTGIENVTGAFGNGDALVIGSGFTHEFTGALDQVAIFDHALSAAEVQAMYQAADRPWRPATLAQRGAGVTASTWSLAVPTGLEGQYQIDLRTADLLGNHGVTANVWRGIIDTQAPRLVLTATPTGASSFDPAAGRRYAVAYVCAAQDENLSEADFTCPGSNLPPPTRSFDDDPILHSLFPDLAIRNRLARTYIQWESATQTSRAMRACDIYGNCATKTVQLTLDPTPPREPQAVVVAPTEQSIVAASGSLSVTVAATGVQALRAVTLKLDGTVVDTANFAQGDAVRQNQRTLSVTAASEGLHTLVAQATDWNGATQTTLFPVSFTLDTQPPSLSIATAPLTVADTYQMGSGILRFHGTVNDTVGLASVKLRVGNLPFADAIFGDGTWRIAYHVPDPEGQTLPVTVRATDLAGRVTEITQNILADLSTARPPDTTITASPANPSNGNTVSFSFTGTPGERGIGGFECRLDTGTFVPCASPWSLSGLSVGSHTFYVRAIDSQGFVDPTPASFTWRVVAQIYLPLIQRRGQ